MHSDHEYRAVVRPHLETTVAYDVDDGLAALSIHVEYRRDGTDGSEETADAEVDVSGRRVSLVRDGEPLLERDLSRVLASGVVERYGTKLRDYARSTVAQLRGGGSGQAEPATWPIAVTQADGSTVEALRPPAQARFELYRDEADEWRWRLVHRNGNVIADSGEGYTSKRAARNGLESVKRNALGAPVEES